MVGSSLWRSLASPIFVAGQDQPSGGTPRHFSPATFSQLSYSARGDQLEFRVKQRAVN